MACVRAISGGAEGPPADLATAYLLVSEQTVKTHVSSVLAKLGVADRTQAALLAVRQADPQPDR